MEELSVQIRKARKAKGFTLKSLGKKLGVSFTTVAAWEQGKSQPKFPTLVMLTKVLDTKFEFPDPMDDLWDAVRELDALETGVEETDRYGYKSPPLDPSVKTTVSVVGYVGAGGAISPIDDHEKGAGLDEVERPPNAPRNTVAVKVKGDSMYPMLIDGMVLYYSKREPNISDYINRLVIAHFEDGRKAIKTLQNGSRRGVFTLVSFNAPPMIDVRLESVSPIDWIKPS